MAKLKTKIKFTYEDYKNLPESETRRYELLEGELVMVPSPNYEHQRISGNLEFILRGFIQERNLGIIIYAPFDVHLGEDIVQPDILFISKERSGIITEAEVRGAPDLVIEVLSLATAGRDRTYKRTLYAKHGVKEYWLVDPEKKAVEVCTLKEKGFEIAGVYNKTEILTSPLLLCLSIDLKKIFQQTQQTQQTQ